MNRFFARCVGIVIRPRRTIEEIAASSDWAEGLAATSLFGAAYSLASLTAFLTGHMPLRPTPRLIPRERYYLWESLFVVPLTLLWMGLFAGFTRQSTKWLGGSGTARADFAVLAFTQSVPMIAGFAVPDLLCYLLRLDEHAYRRAVRLYGPAAVSTALGLSSYGIAKAERIPGWKAVLAVAVSEALSAIGSGVAILVR